MANSLEDLQRALERFRVGVYREVGREINRTINEVFRIVYLATPDVTGETRRSIERRFFPGGAVVRIRRGADANKWIRDVERRHGMFRRGRAHIDRVFRARLLEAVKRAGDSAFGG